MEDFFLLEPEVSGGLGPNTVIDRSAHPPLVSLLQYCFDGWLGDELLETFPCFIVTETLGTLFTDEGFTGFQIATVDVVVSDRFVQQSVQRALPVFVWLQVNGIAGKDDFGVGLDNRLVVSARALALILPRCQRGLTVESFANR